MLIAEMPDNVQAAAMALAVGAGGACSAYKTTVLLAADEATRAMNAAAGSVYQPATA